MSVMLYAESDLVVPALRILQNHPEGADMSILIPQLTELLEPTGKDAELLKGRKDTHFSQKVRNLKSHNTLEQKGLARYEEGRFFITDKGIEYAAGEYGEIAAALREQGSSEEVRNEAFKKDYADVIVEEGLLSVRSVTARSRSRKLTEIARAHFARDGRIACAGCGFDFLARYGERGRGYIEIHHTHPIHVHDIEGEQSKVAELLTTLVPLCSNCHRMVHRKRSDILSVDALRETIARTV